LTIFERTLDKGAKLGNVGHIKLRKSAGET
jgi:hypothetical protein